MKKIVLAALSVLFLSLSCNFTALAATGAKELTEIAEQVVQLQLGFGDYILGGKVTESQKEAAAKNDISKTLPGTYKFSDGNIFVVAKADDDRILGIYKDFPVADRQTVKNMVGDLMMRFEEPTTMAHDKVIYWAYNKNGKIGEDEYSFAKKTGETDMIATVKFQSTTRIFPDKRSGEESESKPEDSFDAAVEAVEKGRIYVIISSNPMSKIFLALNNKE